MRLNIRILIFFLFVFKLVVSQSHPELCKHINHSKALYAAEKSAAISKTNAYDVKHYQINIKVDPEVKFISGNVSCSFIPIDTNLSQFYVDFENTMRVDSIIYKGNQLSFTKTNNQLIVDLQDTVLIGNLSTVNIYYKGVPETNGLGTFVQDSYNEQDSIIWTLSQPYGASSWWPCKNTLTDKADSIDISITCPIGNKAASIGLLKSIDTLGSNVRYNWNSKYPIATYLVAFAVTNYEVFEHKVKQGNDSLFYQHFLYPGDTISINQSLEITPAFLNFFDSLFGPFPFIKEKYGHASFTFGGGMEHQTMSFMGSYGGELIAHELAHQWFGNYITCSSWTDLWLNEAFASYANMLTYEFGVLHNPIYLPVTLQGFRNISFLYPNTSVYSRDTSSAQNLFTRVPYFKGAGVLHMLRWKIGDDAFFNGIRTYLRDSTLAYSFAKTQDLQRHMESASGTDLDEYFKDWYYGKGYPTYTALWAQENGELKVNLQQSQSDPSVYFFNLPIPYKVVGPNIDTMIILDPKFSGQTFSISISENIDSLIFDPDKWISAKSNIVTSVERLNKLDTELEVFPNPSSEVFNLRYPSSLEGKQFKLYNSNGQVVQEGSLLSKQVLNLKNYSKGLYYLHLKELNITRKLLVQ